MDNIISVYWGGLGDNLQFSTLPEGFKLQKNEDTYIHVDSRLRNIEIYELVWGTNPYVLGRSSAAPNAGSPRHGPPTQNVGIRGWEELHGLIPGDGYPKIYLEPEQIDGYQDVILVDTSCKSHFDKKSYSDDIVKSKLQEVQDKYQDKTFVGIQLSDIARLAGEYYSYQHGLETYKINGIFEYYNMIASAFGIVSLHSGGHVMASVIKNMYRPDIKNICLIPAGDYHPDSLYCYDNAEYIFT